MPTLAIHVLSLSLCLSSGFQQGYIASVLNQPYTEIEAYMNSSWLDTHGVPMSAATIVGFDFNTFATIAIFAFPPRGTNAIFAFFPRGTSALLDARAEARPHILNIVLFHSLTRSRQSRFSLFRHVGPTRFSLFFPRGTSALLDARAEARPHILNIVLRDI